MKLLFIVLNKDEYLKDLLTIMTEAGVEGATIIDSQRMAHALAYNVPIFAGLQAVMGQEKAHNKTIFALIEDDNVLTELAAILKEEKIDFQDPETGSMFIVPAEKIK